MNTHRRNLIVILCVAFLNLAAVGMATAGGTMTVTGTINEDGQLVADSGQVYDIAVDDTGAQVMDLSGERITVQGMIEEEEGVDTKMIVIESFQLIQ